MVETSIGVDRCMLALLSSAYAEDEIAGEQRVVLRLTPQIAPVKAGVFPLSKKLSEPVVKLAAELRRCFNIAYDATGSIGKRYRRQDEIGTPYCVTYDVDSESDQMVTIRERDTTEQKRIALSQVAGYLGERILGY